MKFFFELVWQSLSLDRKFLAVSNWPIPKKLSFLLEKYMLLGRHFFKKFELGEDYVLFDGKRIYYSDKYGLAGYQAILTRHQFLIRDIAKIKNPKVIIDIGANVGYFSELSRDLFPEAEIYAFEPVPLTYHCLELNFQDDSKMHCIEAAASDFNGETMMDFDNQKSFLGTLNTGGTTKVKSMRLDDFVKDQSIKSVDLLKIDAETSENLVLKGAEETLAMTKYLFMEVTIKDYWNKDNKNYTISSLLKLLASSRFDFQLVAYRTFSDKGEGETPAIDMLLKNIMIIK